MIDRQTSTGGAFRSEASYTVSVAAELLGMHAQTLRQYDRLGLVTPERTKGRGRRYGSADLDRLRHIQTLTQRKGINLAGVERILALEDELDSLRSELATVLLTMRSSSAPTRGVFTADSSGRVQLRPYTQAHNGRSTPLGPESSMPLVARNPRSEVPKIHRPEEVRPAKEEQLAGEPPPALELAKTTGAALAIPGLTGWTLLAALRLRQLAAESGRGKRAL